MINNINDDLNMVMFKSKQDHQPLVPWTLLQLKNDLLHISDFYKE